MSEIIERLAVLETQIKNLSERLDEYDDQRSWFVKTVFGILIAAVLGILIQRVGA